MKLLQHSIIFMGVLASFVSSNPKTNLYEGTDHNVTVIKDSKEFDQIILKS